MCTGVLICPYPDQERNKLGSMSGTRAISTTSRRELSSGFFFFLQGKAPKGIHAILTETLACFVPGQAKDLSAPLQSSQVLRLMLAVSLSFVAAGSTTEPRDVSAAVV